MSIPSVVSEKSSHLVSGCVALGLLIHCLEGALVQSSLPSLEHMKLFLSSKVIFLPSGVVISPPDELPTKVAERKSSTVPLVGGWGGGGQWAVGGHGQGFLWCLADAK